MTERLEEQSILQLIADLGRADLGDPRRVARAQQVARRLAAMPNASLPDAMVTDAELEGAYRLFSNDHVSFERLIEAHLAGACERASASNLVLAIHDTTQCHFPHADPDEVGYLNTGKAGFQLHLTLLADTREWKRPLGLAAAEILTRDKPPRRRGSKHARSSYQSARDSGKEFERWWRGVEATEGRFRGTTTKVIHLADRETDSFELLARMVGAGYGFVFRSRHQRNVLGDDGARRKLGDLVSGADDLFEREVPLSRRLAAPSPRSRQTHPPREARIAKLRFSTTTATLRRPAIAPRDLPSTVTVNVLHVYEVNAPDGQEPVQWTLFTTEEVSTRHQAERVVDMYRCRWLIEELNKALKTGCVVQKRQLESYDALTTMLAMSLPIAVELLALRAAARAEPTMPANRVMSREQLAALRHMSHRPLPADATIVDVLWCIAGLGGHIKNNGWPGWQVLQRGMEKYDAFAAGWCAHAVSEM